ncbi:hypothetical protein FRC07_002303 [Ceratobasidium sp. 392]|nr:hypothetical protein FRC07_002303 [Ceratobasidium sp. 392]
MAPSKPYVCICLNRRFETQKALTLHENVCAIVAERDHIRYAPYRRKPRTQASASELSVTEPETKDNEYVDEDVIPTAEQGDPADDSIAEANTTTLEDAPRAASPVPPPSNTYPATCSRTRRLFEDYRDTFDALPEAPPPIPQDSAPIPSTSSRPARTRVHNATLEDYVDHNFAPEPQTEPSASTSVHDAIAPCPNLSTFYFLRWFWKGSNKSVASREELQDVLLRPDFNPADLAGVNLTAIDKKLAETPYTLQDHGGFDQADGWVKRSVPVQVPLRQKGPRGGSRSGHQILVPGLHSRSILDGIRKQFSHNDPTHVHFEPFKSLWVPPGKSKSEAQTLMGEIYNSPEMIEEYKEIQKLKISDTKCTLPRVPAAVMLGSDALQLGPFSTKKAWMLYMWLGNVSKYERLPMDLIHKMGTRSDMRMRAKTMRRDNLKRQKLIRQAQDLIYNQHKAVDNAEVEKLLQPESLVPTENAFSRRLYPFGFDFFKIFVVDLLHEIELGVWKLLLTHLLRILHSQGSNVVAEFNKRFREVPTFSNSTIRKFSEDVASLKRLAARDLEDILQCCMPFFKGLMPESIDSQVQHLLFTLAYWHGLAKLRLHTSATLKKLSEVTIQLGDELRAFQDATKGMEVLETPREFAARQRKAAARAQRHQTANAASVQVTRQVCKLNLNTPKFHAVGHYVSIIARYGTTDSFSTQSTELQHRKIKAQWHRTNMRDAISQMTRIGDIGDALDAIQDRLNKLNNPSSSNTNLSSSQELVDSSQAYGIGQSSRPEDALNIVFFVQDNCQEPCVKFFVLLLKQHLLSRITGVSEAFNLRDLEIVDDRMYTHATLHINYTSYDIRRQHDVVKPNSSCPFILLPNDTTNDSTHPFLYAKVLGIYHARVRFRNRPPRRMDFLWVRWLDYDDNHPGGWEHGHLDRVHYTQYRNDAELQDAFGFVDPRHVMRACHLIPDFSSGHAAHSVSLVCDNAKGDWQYYCVDRFVDRDMVMRYLGGGVGHLNQHTPIGEQTEYVLGGEDQELETEADESDADERLDKMDETGDRGDEEVTLSDREELDSDTGENCDDSDGPDTLEGDEAADEDDFIEDLYDL